VSEETPNTEAKKKRSPFPPLFWLVILFEFFERGSYYGMMSVLSVYMTDVLDFAKQDVGVIKATIQPLLYFLPILSGALADRFGYRRTLMVAFAFLGGGYFLTSQATEYTWVFLALVVMGFGAGTFKPVISGSIARCTDESNSTLGFGIYYWSINVGAFLFPLVLVPYLKNNVGWDWVIIASAIGTGAMLLPTIFVFREPPAPGTPPERREGAERRREGGPAGPKDRREKDKASLLQTLANAFEIIYSPFVLLFHLMRRSPAVGGLLVLLALGLLFGYGGWLFARSPEATYMFSARAYQRGSAPRLVVRIERNLGAKNPFKLVPDDEALKKLGSTTPKRVTLTLHDPDRLERYAKDLRAGLRARRLSWVTPDDLERFVVDAGRKTALSIAFDPSQGERFRLTSQGEGRHLLTLVDADVPAKEILARVQGRPDLAGLGADELGAEVKKANQRPFFLPFVGLLLLASLLAIRLADRFQVLKSGGKLALLGGVVGGVVVVIWALQLAGYLSLFAGILCTIIASTLASLFAIDHDDRDKYKDHFRFLLMIFIYSGFWVLYFQMFDSVCWYVKAYVDASSLDAAVNGFLGAIGLSSINFRFDIEHVTVINAGTIILLQLLVSNVVKNTRALPTMVVGIGLGTLGMGILAISTGIWVFMAGITVFSIGEMTAHPKFISYVGQSAPKSRVAMYMGYIFLYGVIGSSIGSMVGANLYVKFVDQLNQPRTLWLIFTGIGVATIVGLLAYNMLVGKKDDTR
jgi:dipeptide/tripeptide permease